MAKQRPRYAVYITTRVDRYTNQQKLIEYDDAADVGDLLNALASHQSASVHDDVTGIITEHNTET